MNTTTGAETIQFTTKGQVVIPAKFRREFHIEEGTRAVVVATPEGILLKPVTRHSINRLRGILKRKPGGKPFAEEWAEHKRAERESRIADMPATPVLDSHALLAFLRGEAGEAHVAALLEKAGLRDAPLHMTEVNYAEVKYMVMRKDGPERWAEVARDLPTLPIEFHPADRRLAETAADFKARFKISLADAFAAALAKERKAELVTGDPEFEALAQEIKIAWLKPS